jgi:uncharacterized protein YPO0396
MAFCLAGALSFNLATSDTDDLRPVFAQLMLDEAFSKSDPQFAHQALSATHDEQARTAHDIAAEAHDRDQLPDR